MPFSDFKEIYTANEEGIQESLTGQTLVVVKQMSRVEWEEPTCVRNSRILLKTQPVEN
jgi:hypothetical protein